MDQYPIRRQIADLESQVLSLAKSLALLPPNERALAAADLEHVREALAQLQAVVSRVPEEVAEPKVGGTADRTRHEGEPNGEEASWTANRTTRLYAINAALAVALTQAQVAQVVVGQALPAVSADAGIILLSADGATFRAFDEGANPAGGLANGSLLADTSPLADAVRHVQPLWIESPRDLSARYHGWNAPPWSDASAIAVVPLVIQGRVLGVMAFRFASPRTFAIADRAFMLVLAQQCAAALERVELYEQTRQAAAAKERNRLARDLHDSVSQALYAIVLSVTAGRASLQRDAGRVARALENIESLAAGAQADLRALLFDLRADSVAQTGLVNALIERVQFLRLRHGLSVRTELDPEPDLDALCKEALYGIAREALHNAAKHARARQVELILTESAEGLLLEVRDDGDGFVPGPRLPGHYGLQSMRERAAELGADLKIETTPGHGTRVTVFVPASSQSALGGQTSRCA